MATTGTTTIDFGAPPGGNTAITVVTGQAGIVAGSYLEAWLEADTTADHNAEEHMLAPILLRCGSIVPGTGFTINARCEWRLTKTFTVRWVWA